MKIFCGIDFGTTNTVVSLTGKGRTLSDSFSVPTTIFIPFENQGIGKVLIGKEALQAYEQGQRGRYIHSIKRSLSDPYLRHTTINRTYVKLENIICLFLEELKAMMRDRWAIVPRNIVLGRPVRFSIDEELDQMANERLLKSFKMAGFEEIIQLEEPVAASICFERDLDQKDKSVIIMDLGGGTSDFSLIERHPEGVDKDKYFVKSTGGIDIGGDIFDEELMFSTLSQQLGIEATFESFGKRLPMPIHLYKDVCRWNTLHLFDKKKMADEFRDYLFRSDDSIAIHRLRAVMENKLSHKILYAVRECKHELGQGEESRIFFNDLGLGIDRVVKQRELSDILLKPVKKIMKTMIHSAGGETPLETIDRVILTGGSSRVVSIENETKKLFDFKKILLDSDFYNSVSKGLSLYAYDKNLTIE